MVIAGSFLSEQRTKPLSSSNAKLQVSFPEGRKKMEAGLSANG